ncbi:hypothetical protein ACHAXR_002585, partial [Thalassiosira sp. AJA248-18]
MCIIFVALHVHPNYPLVIASNRDEFLDRPAEPMGIWANHCDAESASKDDSDISPSQNCRRERRRVSLAGRDLVGGGTWLGIALPVDAEEEEEEEEDNDENGDVIVPVSLRWIAITNFREVGQRGRPRRGGPLMEYLDGGGLSAHSFLHDLHPRGHEYNGFNLLVGDKSGIYYYGNRVKDEQGSSKPQPLTRGIYGLSNGLLDSPWPKVERGKTMLQLICQKDTEEQSSSLESFHEKLMGLLTDQTQPADDQLPRTGLDISSERYLSSIFIPKGLLAGKDCGTRSSTTIVVELDGTVSV